MAMGGFTIIDHPQFVVTVYTYSREFFVRHQWLIRRNGLFCIVHATLGTRLRSIRTGILDATINRNQHGPSFFCYVNVSCPCRWFGVLAFESWKDCSPNHPLNENRLFHFLISTGEGTWRIQTNTISSRDEHPTCLVPGWFWWFRGTFQETFVSLQEIAGPEASRGESPLSWLYNWYTIIESYSSVGAIILTASEFFCLRGYCLQYGTKPHFFPAWLSRSVLVKFSLTSLDLYSVVRSFDTIMISLECLSLSLFQRIVCIYYIYIIVLYSIISYIMEYVYIYIHIERH